MAKKVRLIQFYSKKHGIILSYISDDLLPDFEDNEMTDKPNYMSVFDKQIQTAENNLDAERTSKLDESMGGIGNVEKIRDILFGTHIRDYDKRFKRLEDRLIQEGQQLRDDISQRIRALEELLNTEIDALSEKAKVDRQERILSVQDLQQELGALKNELNNRSSQLEEQFGKELKQLRQQLHLRSQEFSTQLRSQNENLNELIKQEITALQEEKVSRNDLAAFFSEFSLRLKRSDLSKDE